MKYNSTALIGHHSVIPKMMASEMTYGMKTVIMSKLQQWMRGLRTR